MVSSRLLRRPRVLPYVCALSAALYGLVQGLNCTNFVASSVASLLQVSQRGARTGARAAGLGDGVQVLLAETASAGFPVELAVGAGAIVLLGALLLALKPSERTDGAKEEELPPWGDMVQVTKDVISGQPFDSVLLNMRARHGDAFRIYVPSLFGEVIVLMGREANQFVFTEQDKNLDQALGGVVGTAVSGKKTMGTKERKSTESGKIFDKASADFFANKKALARATQIFVDSAEDFCDQMERVLKPDENVFEKLWTYVVQTNADMLYGNGENAGSIVCKTISSINKEGLFSSQVRQAGDDLRQVLNERYQDRKDHPEKYLGEDSLFEEFFLLSKGEADEEMLTGLQQFMLTLQLAANGNQLVTIRWLMSHVYGDPAILAGVRAEVQQLLLKKGCGIRDLKLDDLLSLSLTNACITEAVRLHSDIPSKLTLRSAEIPMEFGGFKIPKGATLFLYADAVHKDDKYFPDAASFCPHRYTDPEAFNQMNKDREIVAFGHGRKRCTGELHARSQISALLASFVMRFDMDLVTNEKDNQMPEDHDGPFVFDTANTLKLVNLRPRAPGASDGASACVSQKAIFERC
ncbi:unnamed protein product [Effrenium voratum]|uniref:Cytochrome P450 n=2 Tax=Effrenium voratum TaxID=2562239 RepID=A0AA36JJZ1_9DINO|nr:unnamed protein product [Effrenium voratum]CAJ1425125.1 unnamed protein product [Effrenium voratum]